MNIGSSPMSTGLLRHLCAVVAVSCFNSSTEAAENSLFSGSFNLRHETVSQDNTLDDADALTLSSRVSFQSPVNEGFSVFLEVENVSRPGGIDDYSVPVTGFNTGRYSVIADPESTELDQAYVQYRDEQFSVRVGRQLITHDSHRFVGHVGWRQDRQTFDAITATLAPSEDFSLSYSYLDERRRIFADAANIDSSDHLLRGQLQTGFGLLVGYGYFLEADTPGNPSLDTVGARLSGETSSTDLPVTYLAELATQESRNGSAEFDASYYLLELGIQLFDGVTARVGREMLGSDNGAYGFATPLATLHAFNGWGDLFLQTPSQGLVDQYLNFSGSVLGGNWAIIYHDYSADAATSGIDDFGNEWNLQFVRPINDHFTFGIKYARYDMGDALTLKPDTDKTWIWINARF